MNNRTASLLRAALLAGFVVASAAPAAATTFSKITDTNAIAPGTSVTFTKLSLFDTPAIDNGNVVFKAFSEVPGSDDIDGIYTTLGGPLSRVVQTGQLIPDGGTDTFASGGIGGTFGFSSPTISGNDIAFVGHNAGNLEDGVYARFGGLPLETIADTRGSSPFTTLSSPAISNGNIGFWTFSVFTSPVSLSFETIQRHQGGSGGGLSDPPPATEDDFVPGKNEPTRDLNDFNAALIDQDGLNTSFLGRDTTNQWGIYTTFGDFALGAPRTYDGDPIPDGGGATFKLQFTQSISADNEKRAFIAGDASFSVLGVYGYSDSFNEFRIADLTTPVPVSGGTFKNFNAVSIEGTTGDVVFLARNAGGDQGLYTNHGGVISKLIEVGDTLDGKIVTGLSFGHEGLDGTTAVFAVTFDDASEGIFTTDITTGTVPEPATLVLMGVGGLMIARGRRA